MLSHKEKRESDRKNGWKSSWRFLKFGKIYILKMLSKPQVDVYKENHAYTHQSEMLKTKWKEKILKVDEENAKLHERNLDLNDCFSSEKYEF